jgi:phosphatidylinositol alpha 1,6-mannosyltransferase
MRDKPMDVRALRVAYFAGTMKPGHDGVTRVLYRLIDAIKDEHITNVFYSPLVPPEGHRPTEMVRVPSVSIPVYKEYRFAMPGHGHFEQHLSAFRPDLIHIHSPCSLGFAAVKYGQAHGTPVVATYHTHFPSYARYYKVRPLELLGWNYLRTLYSGCHRVYVPSRPVLMELVSHGFKNLMDLPHGVDTTAFQPGYRNREWKEKLGIAGKYALLFAGRLVWEKDLQVLADTYKLLQRRRSDIAFVLAGDGPIRSELQEMMPGAIFLGHQEGADLSVAYASSDLFVFPSTTETFGNVVLEAMASGLVPICSRQGGPAGIIQHGVTGLLTNPRDPGELAESIEHLVDNRGARTELRDSGLLYAQSQTWERIFQNLFRDYEAVIQEFPLRQTKRRRKAA